MTKHLVEVPSSDGCGRSVTTSHAHIPVPGRREYMRKLNLKLNLQITCYPLFVQDHECYSPWRMPPEALSPIHGFHQLECVCLGPPGPLGFDSHIAHSSLSSECWPGRRKSFEIRVVLLAQRLT